MNGERQSASVDAGLDFDIKKPQPSIKIKEELLITLRHCFDADVDTKDTAVWRSYCEILEAKRWLASDLVFVRLGVWANRATENRVIMSIDPSCLKLQLSTRRPSIPSPPPHFTHVKSIVSSTRASVPGEIATDMDIFYDLLRELSALAFAGHSTSTQFPNLLVRMLNLFANIVANDPRAIQAIDGQQLAVVLSSVHSKIVAMIFKEGVSATCFAAAHDMESNTNPTLSTTAQTNADLTLVEDNEGGYCHRRE